MDKRLVLSNEPLPETASTITLEVFSSPSEGVTRRSGLLQKKELEGKITFNPEGCLIYSLPPTGFPTPQVIAPDRTQWDLYLIIIPFTLHKPADDRYYEEMTFFATIADRRITAFDLFPKHITTEVEEAGIYTLSPQLIIGPAEASMKQGGRHIHFPSLHPVITAFGKGESSFYWVYEKSPVDKRVIPETKHVLVVLQVPRQTTLVDLTISYEMAVARQMLGLWRYRDAATDEYEIQWDLSKAQPFYESGSEQTLVETGRTQRDGSLLENACFDVCVICALTEEARAFIQETSRVCGVQFERAFAKQLELEYYHTRILNAAGEPLTIQVSWLPGYGPLEVGLHLKPLLETFKPRFAAMTGICAGNKRRVKLGDLIVADRAYFYDSGKFIIDEYGNQGQIHRADVYHISTKIRRFIGMFEQWKSLVEPPEPACYIGAMASGNAVRGDNLFDKAQFPVRDTLAIDMEGAAFYRIVEDFPEMYALLVKGVADYADGNKDDSFHECASAASAVYMLAFIQEYITADRMPRNQTQET